MALSKNKKSKRPSTPVPVAVGLCRCSTDRQDRSIAEQEAAIRAWAKGHDVRLVQVFKDEGVSGLELSRPGLDACMEYLARSREKGVVVLWSRDRLVRPEDPIDGLVMERQIRYAGWELCYLTGSNATGHPLVDAILGLVEHHASGEYLRKLARDSLRNLLGRLKAGNVPGGKIPFGYAKAILDDDGRLIRVVPRGKKHRKTPSERTQLVLGEAEEVETVRWIFTEYEQGWFSLGELAARLNARGGPRPTRKGWNHGTLRDMLVNPVYVGDVVWNRETTARCVRLLGGELSADLAMHESSRSGRRIAWARNDPKDHIVLRDRHEPIITREQFGRVQTILGQRGSRERDGDRLAATRRSFALGAVLFCGKCGTGMYSRTTTVKGYVYRYYYCPDKSHPYTIRADKLEEAVLTELRGQLRAPGVRRAASRKTGKTKSPAKLLVDLETALEQEEWSRARVVFLVLLERVELRALPGRPPKHRKGRARPWRAILTPGEAAARVIGARPIEIRVE